MAPVPVLLPVYAITSLSNAPLTAFIFLIIRYPETGKALESVKVKVFCVALIDPFKVVSCSKVETATPPTGTLTSLNLTYVVP